MDGRGAATGVRLLCLHTHTHTHILAHVSFCVAGHARSGLGDFFRFWSTGPKKDMYVLVYVCVCV